MGASCRIYPASYSFIRLSVPALLLLSSLWIFRSAIVRAVGAALLHSVPFANSRPPPHLRLWCYGGHASSCWRCQTFFYYYSYFAVIITNSMRVFLLSCCECFLPSGLLLDSVSLLILMRRESPRGRICLQRNYDVFAFESPFHSSQSQPNPSSGAVAVTSCYLSARRLTMVSWRGCLRE